MKNINPPHEVRDQVKLNTMIASLQAGHQLPAIVVCHDLALTGSHRIAAWDACDMDYAVIEIDDDEYINTMINIGLDYEIDTLCDFNIFCESLYNSTNRDDLKKSLSDQF